jgi:hypothetical protein
VEPACLQALRGHDTSRVGAVEHTDSFAARVAALLAALDILRRIRGRYVDDRHSQSLLHAVLN